MHVVQKRHQLVGIRERQSAFLIDFGCAVEH